MQTATIRSDGYGRFIWSNGAARSRKDYATPQNAKAAAEKAGYQVTGDLPDPNARSIASYCTYQMGKDGFAVIIVKGFDEIAGDQGTWVIGAPQGTVEMANRIFRKMGFKPVRLTRNILNPNSPTIVIDEDTPAACDPGTETYHCM